MKTFQLEVVTPESQIFSGSVQSVKVPGSMGSFEVLYNHAPLISTLGRGQIRIKDDSGSETEFITEDGLVEVLKNKVIILVEKVLS